MTATALDPIAILAASITRQRKLASQTRAELDAATPLLIAAIRHGSGQSAKIEQILWSCWNGDMCDQHAGLDTNLAEAVVAIITARAYLGGDADDLLRRIIEESNSHPPKLRAEFCA